MALRTRSAVVVFGLLLSVGGATASSRALADTPPTTRAHPPADLAPAKSAFDEGVRQYNLGNYESAVEYFRTAYLLSGRVDILFNIAQAYRLAGDCARAELSYRSYLREKPDTHDRVDVERRVEEMDACAPKRSEPTPVEHDKKIPSTPLPSPNAAEASRPEHAPRPTESAMPRILRIAAVGAGVVAAGLAVSGIYFSLSGASDERLLRQQGWNPEVDARGERANTLAVVSYVGAGVTAVAALALWIVAGRAESHKTAAMNQDSWRLLF